MASVEAYLWTAEATVDGLDPAAVCRSMALAAMNSSRRCLLLRVALDAGLAEATVDGLGNASVCGSLALSGMGSFACTLLLGVALGAALAGGQ